MFAIKQWFSKRWRDCDCCAAYPHEMESTNTPVEKIFALYACLQEISCEETRSPYCVVKTLKCTTCGALWCYDLWGTGHQDVDWRLTTLPNVSPLGFRKN